VWNRPEQLPPDISGSLPILNITFINLSADELKFIGQLDLTANPVLFYTIAFDCKAAPIAVFR
jgi:hypothetical protein